MIFVISFVFIFLTRLKFPFRLSIAEVMSKRYGDRTFKLVKELEKADTKHKKALLDLQFLKIWEDYNVIPKFLRFKFANSNLRSSSTYRRCQRKLLREEIYSWVSNRRTPCPQLINFSVFSTQNILIPPLRQFIIGKVSNSDKLFETIYLYWLCCDFAKGTEKKEVNLLQFVDLIAHK